MDHDFQWTTREEKMEVVRYWWRQQRAVCCICKDEAELMEPYGSPSSPWVASIEHLVPKRDNGPDTVGNVRLAHRWCNNVMGALWQINKDREKMGLEPLSAEWALSGRRAQARLPIDVTRAFLKNPEHRGTRGAMWKRLNAKYPKAARGTLYRAIESGELRLRSRPRGATLPKEPTLPDVYEHSKASKPRKLTGLELAQFLRENALKNGQKWPLA